ncbi:MAG: hypothetical protein ACRDZR_02260 [Acidimicrobiales bacterium]
MPDRPPTRADYAAFERQRSDRLRDAQQRRDTAVRALDLDTAVAADTEVQALVRLAGPIDTLARRPVLSPAQAGVFMRMGGR